MNPLYAGASSSLGAFLADVLLTFPSEVALIEVSRHREVHRWTYGDVRGEVGRACAALTQLGLVPGGRVAIVMSNQSRWLVVAMAVFRLGGVLVPLDHKLTPPELDALLQVSGASILVSEYGLGRHLHGPAAQLVLEAPARVELPSGSLRYEDLPDAPAPAVVERERTDPATVVYSSGTGGEPKGCVLSHGAYLAQLEALLGLYPMTPGQRYFSFLPTNHAIDFMCGFLAPFACGATVVHQRTLRPEFLRSTLKRYQITHMSAVPRILESFREAIQERLDEVVGWRRAALDGMLATNRVLTERRPRPEISQRLLAPVLDGVGGKLQLVFTGGAYVPPELAMFFYQFGISVVIGYGLTEACTVLTVNDLAPFRADSVGAAIPGVELRILGADEGGIGEVEVRGPTLMSHYDQAPELTAAAFTEDGWLRTGDRGWLDAAGHLHLVGRSRNLIVTAGGKNVYPEDVEGVFRDVPCDELAVFATDFLYPEGAVLGAESLTVVVHPDAPLDVLRRHNRTLADYKRVSHVLRWAEPFPRTASLKLKRQDLALAVRAGSSRATLERL